jgi:6-phosphogluconolactonase/glucosamine-6-phosphate isomerase/deaminase
MQLEVYESDAEAIDAAAALAETALAEAASARLAVAISGGRSGRAFMLALARRDGMAWSRLRLCVADESPAGETGAVLNRHVLSQHVLEPRGIAGGMGARNAAGDPVAERAAFEAEVEAVAGPQATFDLVVLELGAHGELGVLAPGSAVLDDASADVVHGDGGRIGLGPGALRRARRVIVLALGAQCRQALAAAMRPADGARRPASLVSPSARATWLVDRAAAAVLLRDARMARA